MKIANIDRNIHLRNFNETFSKDVTCNNIKNHKKSGSNPLFRRYIFRKTTVARGWEGNGEGQIDPQPF